MKKFAILIAVISLTSCRTDNKTDMTEEELNKIFARDSAVAIKDPLVKLDRDSVKKTYGDKFNDLRTIINKHDPIGLIANGAPDDEYEPEVKTIIVQLDNKTTEQQIHDLVYQEFIRWFDDESTAGQNDSYKDLAKDIFVWTKKTTTR
jgi:hypothetical protein